MPAALAPLIISAIPAIMKGITGISQSSTANKLADEYGRPNMPIPTGMLNAVDITKNLAFQSGFPRADLVESRIDEQIAGAIGGAKDAATNPWELTSMSNRLYEGKTEKLKDLSVTGEQMRQGNQLNLAEIMTQLAGTQERRFMMNEYGPYLNAMESSRQLRGAGIQNAFSGVSDMAGIGLNFADVLGAERDQSKARDLAGATSRLESLFSGIEDSLAYKAI